MSEIKSEFLDPGEAAEFLRIKLPTIYAWVHQRRVPFRKHGGKLVFYRPDLEAWSAQQAVQTYEETCIESDDIRKGSRSLKTRDQSQR